MKDNVGLKFHALGPKTSAYCFDYDQSLSVMDRQACLEYLFSIQGVSFFNKERKLFSSNGLRD